MMSLDKAIEHGKEKRKPYYGRKEFDPICRPHGCCRICMENRFYSTRKRKETANQKMKEYENEYRNIKQNKGN